MLLRIEDTDRKRLQPGSVEAIERDLRWGKGLFVLYSNTKMNEMQGGWASTTTLDL